MRIKKGKSTLNNRKTANIVFIVVSAILLSCGGNNNSVSGGREYNVNAVVVKEIAQDEWLHSTGNILPDEQLDLMSEIPGRISGIFFEEGAAVSKGQLLVKIDDSELQAELRKAVYEKELLKEKEVRQKHLLEIKAISTEEYETHLKMLNVADANISLLNARIEKTELRAPFGGLAGLRYVSPGASITPSTIITNIRSTNHLKVEISVPGKYFNLIKTGDTIYFDIQGIDSTFLARIYAVEPGIDESTRSLRMRAIFNNKGGKVMPGAFANIRISPLGRTSSIMIPTKAIIPDAGKSFVIVSKEGKASRREVATGYRSQTHIEIVSGLQEGDTVLTDGILQVRDGMPVNVLVNMSKQ